MCDRRPRRGALLRLRVRPVAGAAAPVGVRPVRSAALAVALAGKLAAFLGEPDGEFLSAPRWAWAAREAVGEGRLRGCFVEVVRGRRVVARVPVGPGPRAVAGRVG
jgi:hypothetical protein